MAAPALAQLVPHTARSWLARGCLPPLRSLHARCGTKRLVRSARCSQHWQPGAPRRYVANPCVCTPGLGDMRRGLGAWARRVPLRKAAISADAEPIAQATRIGALSGPCGQRGTTNGASAKATPSRNYYLSVTALPRSAPLCVPPFGVAYARMRALPSCAGGAGGSAQPQCPAASTSLHAAARGAPLRAAGLFVPAAIKAET
jgi:hypothetical protein